MSARRKYRNTSRGRDRGGRAEQQRVRVTNVYGREHFRYIVRRPRGGLDLPDLRLDTLVTDCTWGRAGARRTVSMSISWPEAVRNIGVIVAKGDIVRCEVQVRDGAPWRPLWEATVVRAIPSVKARTSDLQLRSALTPATKSRKSWRYRDDRDHPDGWTADQITLDACRRFDVPVGSVPAGQHRIKKLHDKSASVVDVVGQAWKREREWTGRRFDVSIARGVLEVVELRRPDYLLPIRDALIDAVVDDGIPEGFCSALLLTATVKKRGSTKRRKITVKVVDKDRVRRYGYVRRRRKVDDDKIETEAELRKHGERLLARAKPPIKTATLTLPGIPWADRGDATELVIPEVGISTVVFVRSVEHRVSSAGYEMDLVVSVTDPWKHDEREARVRRKKAAAARQRQRDHAERPARRKPKGAKDRA